MNKYHKEILEEIKKESKGREVLEDKYFGTKRINYKLSQPQSRVIAKNWCTKHKDISFDEFIETLNSLYKGESHDERTFGGKLLEYLPKLRKQIDLEIIDIWLTGAQGWWEVDSLCQMCFSGQEMLSNWVSWEKLLNKLVSDPDVHKRRASLVLLTGPVRQPEESRFSEMAFKNIEKIKGEKDILITKAISWLLRALIKNHKEEVKDYLKNNISTLPKIATREVQMKLLTGKKTKRNKP